jgi:hypothetical protein
MAAFSDGDYPSMSIVRIMLGQKSFSVAKEQLLP